MSTRLKKSSSGVAHHTPGRTRLKVPHTHRHPEHLDRVKVAIEEIEGVAKVHVNHRTGSITVHHDTNMAILEAIALALEKHSGELLSLLAEEAPALGEIGLVAAGVGVVGSLFKGVLSKVTAGEAGSEPLKFSDLKTMIPAGFLAAGLYQALRTESIWKGITPLALLYWAFDSYWKLNVDLGPRSGSTNGHERTHN